MTACTIPNKEIEATIAFHGHSCPGLSIGIRAAELARLRWPGATDQDLVAVPETDMCGVDAIQFLLGCTLGKGNLILRDFGKMAFSFFHRPTGEGFRALLKPDCRRDMDEELGALMIKADAGKASLADEERIIQLRIRLKERFLTTPLDNLFYIQKLEAAPPSPARILSSLRCDSCGEMTMESRTRRFGGKTLCIPCFQTVEQKV